MKRRKDNSTSIFQPLRYLNYLPVLLILLFNPNLSEEQNPDQALVKVKIDAESVKFVWLYSLSSSVRLKKVSFGIFDFPSQPNSLTSTFAIKQYNQPVLINPGMASDYQGRISIYADEDDSTSADMTISPVLITDHDKIFGIKIEVSNGENFFRKTRLQIVEDPVIRIPIGGGDQRYQRTEGDFLMLNCTATGRPTPRITWKRNDSGIVISTGSGSKSLTFEKLSKDNHSAFNCLAENDERTSYTATVIVNYSPIIDEQKSTKRAVTYVANKNPVALKCVAYGRPAPTYQWRDRIGKLLSRNATYILVKPTVAEIDFQYKCRASNGIEPFKEHFVNVVGIGVPGKVNVNMGNSGARFVSLGWQFNGDTGKGTLKTVEISYLHRGKEKTHKYPVSRTSATFKNLVPYTTYRFSVLVKNEFFPSEPVRIEIKTDEAAPGPPLDLIISTKTSRTIKVSWTLPIEPNGNITQYEVGYRKTSNSLQSFKIEKPRGLQRSQNLTSLQPFTEYTVKVRAFTQKRFGGGNWSTMVTGRTLNEAPSQPRNLQAKVNGPNSVTFTWNKPTYIYGPISHFKVKFIWKDNGATKEDIYNILAPKLDKPRIYESKKVEAYTEYQAAIAEGAGGQPLWGNYSNLVKFFTDEGVPSLPRLFQVTHRTTTSLSLSWKRPEKINGILTFFIVYYENKTKRFSIKLNKELNNATFRLQLNNLRDATKYTLQVQAFTKIGAGSISPPYESSTSAYLVETDKLVDDKISTGPIIGGIFSFLVILVLLILLILYIARKQRIQRKAANKSDQQPFNLTPSPEHLVHLPQDEPITKIPELTSTNSNGTAPSGPVLNGNISHRTFASVRPITIDELKEYCDKNHENKDAGFVQEFKSIKAEVDLTWEVSLRAENKCKNRYANIIAYDHSRVILNQIENVPGSNYINANYIDGYKRKGKFIATQGPVAASFNDFWRMVWEQNCHVIVMVTNLIEKSRIKCQKYWPTGDPQQYGSVAVTPEEEIELADYIIRKFSVVMSSSKQKHESRKVTQYQFSSWPDHGVPQYPTGLLQFIKRIRASSSDDEGSIVCHCSAGVGRSGTYITLESMLDQIHDESSIDILGFVTHIRTQRNLMVQTEAQYTFTYDALLEAVICGDTEITVSELPMRIKRLEQVNPESGITYMQEEFERLSFNLDEMSQYETALLEVNATKNRFPSILPFESTRVKLWPYPGVEGSDYINASFVDGYQQREAYIVSQSPLENTVEDVWRMLWEYEIFSILMLSSPEERDMHHCYPYWPVDSEPASFGLLLVQIAAEEERSGYVKREFRVTNSKTGETRVVTHFMFYDWPEDSCPSDPSEVLDMVSQLQKTQQMTGNGSMVIHCNDGCGRTGAICALMFSIERVKLEGAIDIFQTVRMMRTQRTGIIRTLDQYRFCYSALKKFIDTFSDYANFK